MILDQVLESDNSTARYHHGMIASYSILMSSNNRTMLYFAINWAISLWLYECAMRPGKGRDDATSTLRCKRAVDCRISLWDESYLGMSLNVGAKLTLTWSSKWRGSVLFVDTSDWPSWVGTPRKDDLCPVSPTTSSAHSIYDDRITTCCDWSIRCNLLAGSIEITSTTKQ